MKFFMCALLCGVVLTFQSEAAPEFGMQFSIEDFEVERLQTHATEMEFTQSDHASLPKHAKASNSFHKAILKDSAVVAKLQAGKTVTVSVDATLMSTEWYHGIHYALRIDGHDKAGYPSKKHSKWMCWPVGCFHTKCGKETFANNQRAKDSHRAYMKMNCNVHNERNAKKARRAEREMKKNKEINAKKDKKTERVTKAKELRRKKEDDRKQAKEVARKLREAKEKDRKAPEKSKEKKEKKKAPAAPLTDAQWRKLCEVPTKKLQRLRGKCRGYKRFCKLYKKYGMEKDADRHCALMMAAHKKLLKNRLKKRITQPANRRYVKRLIRRPVPRRLLRRL